MPYATNQGVRIRFEVEGKGVPLVLHHGFTERLETWYWNGFVAALKEEYRLILIDSRGQGDSDKPDDPEAYGLAQRTSDVIVVLDTLGIDRAHYFGYSQGGWSGFGLAKYAPQRVRSLSIGGVSPYGQSLAIYRQMMEDSLESCLVFLEKAAGSSISGEIRTNFFKNDLQALRAAYHHDRPDISAILPTISVPCLLFAGEADPLCSIVQRCVADLPHASFFTLPGLNHIQVALQIKEVLPALKKFLATVDAGQSNRRYLTV